MHDKYCYERLQMALHDRHVTRWFATGIAGLSVVADSLSAIKYAKVKAIRDENGIAVDYEVEGDFPKYGNNDDRVDSIAVELVHTFMEYVRMNQTYREGIPTTSILTITVAKLPYEHSQDGISNTFSIIPGALGKEDQVFVGDLEVELDGFNK